MNFATAYGSTSSVFKTVEMQVISELGMENLHAFRRFNRKIVKMEYEFDN